MGLRDMARDVQASVGDAARDLLDVGRRGVGRVRAVGASAKAAFPREALPELAGSVGRLSKVRTPREAVAVFETETERLLTIVTPTLVAHPLPVTTPAAAKSIVATAGGLAAAGEEVEELAALVSGGVAIPHTFPIMIAANMVALAVEVYVAASLRVHDLRAAGLEPDPNDVARDVIYAMTGKVTGDGGITDRVTKQMVKTIVTRVLSRWGAAFVPFAGIAYSGWDAQRTIDAVRALPLPERQALPSGLTWEIAGT